MKLQFITPLAFIILILGLPVFSQITIELQDLEYQDGDYYKVYSRDGSLWIVSGLTGKIGGPYIWDFSSGPTDADYTFDYVIPSTTPCDTDFPLATITERKTGGGIYDAYMFLDFQDGAGRVNYGICQPPTLPSSWIFNPPLIDFPSTIGFMDNWTGNTIFPAESAGLIVDVHYNFNAFCNGYGELILPDGLGQFPCLQVSYLEHYEYYWSGYLLQTSYIRSFYWIIPDAGIAVIISSEEGTTPPPEDFDYSNIYSRMYESSKFGTSNEFNLNTIVFLEGPYDQSSGIMNTTLNPNLMPLNQPFNSPPWNYPGTESVAAIPSIDITDWILIELRDTTQASLATGETRIARKAGFVKSDGSVVDIDGINLPHFDIPISNDLFLAIWHRNHLGIISSMPLVNVSGVYGYNFTTGSDKAHGGLDAQNEINTGVWGMITGDADSDGDIATSDISVIWNYEAGNNGYLSSDMNLDSQVDNVDKDDYWLPNNGSTSIIPE